MNEEEILTLFRRDAEAASEALVAQYRRLLWGICARRLNAPEDIDECVYAALADFCLNWRQFDHSRGTLKSYLISIADKKALDLYRQNLRWQRMQKAAEHCAGQALRAPLEREWLFADMDGLTTGKNGCSTCAMSAATPMSRSRACSPCPTNRSKNRATAPI